jgi:hypothetical protein
MRSNNTACFCSCSWKSRAEAILLWTVYFYLRFVFLAMEFLAFRAASFSYLFLGSNEILEFLGLERVRYE